VAWRHFEIPWLEFHGSGPATTGQVVATAISLAGVWFLNPCRVVYTELESDRDSIAYAYGTLRGHAESGEERFAVCLDPASGEVVYRLAAFSWPALVEAGYPFARRGPEALRGSFCAGSSPRPPAEPIPSSRSTQLCVAVRRSAHGSTGEVAELESASRSGKSALFFFFIGLLALGVNAYLYFYEPYYYPAVWLVGGLLIVISLRALDRRVKLRIGPDGITYTSWGAASIPWTDFERFSVFKYKGFRFIEPRLRNPERFVGNISLLIRIGAWLNRLAGRPGYSINPNQLDVGADDIVGCCRATRRSPPDRPPRETLSTVRPCARTHPSRVAARQELHVDVRVLAAVGVVAAADDEQQRLRIRAVDEVVSVRDAGLEAGGVAGHERHFAAVLDQHDLAVEHVDELVLALVPVIDSTTCPAAGA
jgi:hypothetical protein